MKNRYFLGLLLAALLFGSAAAAQNYRPFRFGLRYQLSASATPGDTTHRLRLASRQVLGGDSVFGFDKRTSAGRLSVQNGCGNYVQRPDNLFGTTLRLRPGAEYVLAAANGRTFTLRPRAAIGQAWTATAAGLTGQVTARTLGMVLGQPDSLATITLSDGAVLVLSKRLGWVSGPALGHYLNPRLPAANLTLTALPDLGLGTDRLGAFAVYDFQPGDVFLRRTEHIIYGFGVPCRSEDWTRDSILSRVLSANGDTLRYRQSRRTFSRGCLVAPALSPATVQTVRILRTTELVSQPTGFWESSAATSNVGLLHLPSWRTSRYNGRLVQQHLVYQQCAVTADSTRLFDTAGLDAGYHILMGAGLGITLEEHLGFSSDITTLMGYRKGTETWGQLPTFAQLLPTRASRPAANTTAFPNPFGAALTAQFILAQPQAVAAELRDALGRVVRQQPTAPLPAGPQQLALPTAGLPAGVYTLHLHFQGEGRVEVLRVVKAE